MGLASYPDTSLAEAREEAKKWRQVRARREAEADRRVATAGIPTFKIAAKPTTEMRKSGRRSVKHKARVSSLDRSWAHHRQKMRNRERKTWWFRDGQRWRTDARHASASSRLAPLGPCRSHSPPGRTRGAFPC
jgi:hypothetical protein